MRKALALFAVVLTLGMSVGMDAEAKRLGGARSSGMQRQAAPPAQQSSPSQPGTPASTPNAPAAAPAAAGTAGAAAAAAPRRSWAGPLTGLAAGLGLAALASYLGFGEALANMMLIALVVMLALVAVSFFMRKRAAAQNPAAAGAGGTPWQQGGGSANAYRQAPETLGRPATPQGQGGSMIGSRLGGIGALGSRLRGTPATPPADFDATAFVRNAKAQFMALQAANDAGDLAQLRGFLTPEMYEVVRDEIASRGSVPQKTEVFGLDGQVVEVTQDGSDYIVSVRFTGSIREQHGAVPEDLDEIWHLTKPATGSGGWVIAGIQQVTTGA